MVQAFLKKWWVESDFKAPNLPLSVRLKGSGCHYNSIYNNTWTKQVKQFLKQDQNQWSKCQRHFCVTHWWKQYFWHFCWNLSLYIFTIWKSIVYNLFCRDVIYFDKILVSEYKLFKRSDCTKTFDTVPHDDIRIKLREYGTTSKLWFLLYYMYTNPLCGGRLSEWLTLHRGDWQGSVLSAKLYFIFVNDLINELEDSKQGALLHDLIANSPV